MTSVLVITDIFAGGGLETQIMGQVRQLRELGVACHLATGSSPAREQAGFQTALTDLPLRFDASFSECDAAITALVEHVHTHDITLIHAHPFASFLIGALVAEQAQVPFVVTLHGPASLAYTASPIGTLLLSRCVLPAASQTFVVSREVELAVRAACDARPTLLPNAVPLVREAGPPGERSAAGRWCWVGRLDQAKVGGLVDLVDYAISRGIPLDVIGDGPSREPFSAMLSERGVSGDQVRLLGWLPVTPSLLAAYEVVCGMGRVVLEALSAERPCLLVGYDGVKGIIDDRSFERAALANFSGRGFATIPADVVDRQLADVRPASATALRARVAAAHDEAVIWRRYLTAISEVRYHSHPLLRDLRDLIGLRRASTSSPWHDAEFGEFATALVRQDQVKAEASALADVRLIGTELKSDLAGVAQQVEAFSAQVVAAEERAQAAEARAAEAEARSRQLEEQATVLQERVTLADEQAATARQRAADVEAKFTEADRLRNYWEYRGRAVEASTSWRLTTPLRRVSTLARLATDGRFAQRLSALRGRARRQGVGSALEFVQDRIAANGAAAPVPSSAAGAVLPRAQMLHRERVTIFASVPFDDVGGGQRSAQLARVLAASGFDVHYIYAFKRYDFVLKRQVDSVVEVARLSHILLDTVSPETVFDGAAPGSVCIFEIPHRAFLPHLRAARRAGVTSVFELIDAWDTSLGGDWFSEDVFQSFIDECDRVVGTAKLLVETLVRRGRPDAEYIPNAANDSIFDHYRSLPKPAEYDPGRRVLLYYGSLYGEWFGWDWIDHAARENPDAIIYLIGEAPEGRQVRDNVRLLGARRIDELPAYLQHCDAALLPFIPGKISDAVSPIKVFEYLAMAKPVIATPMPELAGYPNVHIAADPKEFAQLCGRPDLTAVAPERFIMRNTWASRAYDLIRPAAEQSISVIVLTHNNRTIIDRCLESIALHGAGYVKEVIVVDNASRDGTYDHVRSAHPEVIALANPQNGCSSGRNLGLSRATGDVIAFFDSDQWLTSPLCFKEALAVLAERHDIGAVSWSAGWFDLDADVLGGPICDYLPGRGTLSPEYIVEGLRSDVHYLGTGGLFCRRSDLAGGVAFDTAYDPTCFEDTDFSFQIASRGLRLAYRDFTGIRHQPHQTTGAGGQSESYRKLFQRNSDHFRSKWRRTLANLQRDLPRT